MTAGSVLDNVSERGCAHRVDLGAYTVFVATFIPRGSRHHHGHHDLLSYVVYCDGIEVLCDPGMPSYRRSDSLFAATVSHNGLHPASPLRPEPMAFIPATFATPTLQRHSLGEGYVAFEARNEVLRSWKTLSLRGTGRELVIEESVAPSAARRAASFSHCFSNPAARLADARSVAHGNLQVTYEGLESLALDSAERALEYGERLPCARLTATARDSSAATRIRHV